MVKVPVSPYFKTRKKKPLNLFVIHIWNPLNGISAGMIWVALKMKLYQNNVPSVFYFYFYFYFDQN